MLFRTLKIRDEDFDSHGGHIPGCVHIPSEDFEDEEVLDSLVQRVQEAGSSVVIFHCTQSQIRGPSCANRFLAACSSKMGTNV